MSKDKITIKAYIEYLKRCIIGTDLSLHDAHKSNISRQVARDYGVTEEEILWLDENL